MKTITIPQKTGYTFKGYYRNPGGSGTKYIDSTGKSAHNWDNINNISGRNGRSAPARSTGTLYADWELVKYDINYETHGGKFENDVISHTKSDTNLWRKGRSRRVTKYTIEAEDIVLETPTRKGVEFKEWKKKVNQGE